jgi:hypothetical protein
MTGRANDTSAYTSINDHIFSPRGPGGEGGGAWQGTLTLNKKIIECINERLAESIPVPQGKPATSQGQLQMMTATLSGLTLLSLAARTSGRSRNSAHKSRSGLSRKSPVGVSCHSPIRSYRYTVAMFPLPYKNVPRYNTQQNVGGIFILASNTKCTRECRLHFAACDTPDRAMVGGHRPRGRVRESCGRWHDTTNLTVAADGTLSVYSWHSRVR